MCFCHLPLGSQIGRFQVEKRRWSWASTKINMDSRNLRNSSDLELEWYLDWFAKRWKKYLKMSCEPRQKNHAVLEAEFWSGIAVVSGPTRKKMEKHERMSCEPRQKIRWFGMFFGHFPDFLKNVRSGIAGVSALFWKNNKKCVENVLWASAGNIVEFDSKFWSGIALVSEPTCF